MVKQLTSDNLQTVEKADIDIVSYLNKTDLKSVPSSLGVSLWLTIEVLNYDSGKISDYKAKINQAPWKKKPSDYTKDNYKQLVVTFSELLRRDSYKLGILFTESLKARHKN